MRLPFAAVCLLFAACADKVTPFPTCADPPPPLDAGTAVTWHRHVRPIIEARCSRCHAKGGIAPFPLQTYDDVVAHAGEVRAAVAERTMPPWMPARCCAEYHSDPSLTEQQIATIVTWVHQNVPEGNPSDVGPPLPPIEGRLSRVDRVVQMPEPYTPKPPEGSTDDVRCFLIDLGLSEDKFVTGLNLEPGNPRLVHHVVLGLVDGDSLQYFEELDRANDGPGFPCKGGVGTAQLSGTLGGWVPGSEGIEYPDGLGTPVPAGTRLLLNVHYSTAYAAAAPDQTSIELKLDDSARRFRTAVIANPMWLVDGAMRIEAGSTDTSYSYQYDPTGLFGRGKPMRVHSASVHMHEYATAATVGIVRADGSTDCLLHIPRWKKDWEGFFWLNEPKSIRPGDRLYLECHWNNSPSNPDVAAGGKQKTPHMVDWGSDQDMCAAFLAFVEDS